MRTAGSAGSTRAAGWRPVGDGGHPENRAPHTGSGRAGDRPLTGAFSTLMRQSGLRASTGGILATKSERKMLVSVHPFFCSAHPFTQPPSPMLYSAFQSASYPRSGPSHVGIYVPVQYMFPGLSQCSIQTASRLVQWFLHSSRQCALKHD